MTGNSYIILAAFCAMVSSPYLLRRFSRAGTNSYGAFAIGARNFGWFRIMAGLSATFVGGAAVINLAGLGYQFGWFGLSDVIPTSVSLFFSAFIIVPMLFQRRNISLGGYLKDAGKLVGMTVGLLSTIVYTLITAAQIIALIRVAKPYFDVPTPVIAVVATLAVASYLLYGGYTSVTLTDVIQLFITGLCYFALVGVTLLIAHRPEQMPPVATSTMPLDMILLLALPILFVPVSQDLHIRVNSSINQRHATTGVALAGICYFTFGLISVSVGRTMANWGVQLKSPDDAVPTFLTSHFGALAVIPTVAIICIVVSTLDSVLFAAASSLAYDFWDRLANKEHQKDSTHPRIATLAVLGVALFISLQTPRILHLILTALVIYVSVLLPVVIGRFLRKQSNALGIVSFIALIAVTTLESIGYAAPFRAFLYTAIHLTVVFCLRREVISPPSTENVK